MNYYITNSPQETKKLAQKMASGLKGGEILCLSGDLGAGKTTFTQGLLKALGAEGPYTSPTFTILKEYQVKSEELKEKSLSPEIFNISLIYHIDAYRIKSDDLRELGFLDFAGKTNTVTIIEWPENVQDIIPKSAMWLNFEWIDENRRKITLSLK